MSESARGPLEEPRAHSRGAGLETKRPWGVTWLPLFPPWDDGSGDPSSKWIKARTLPGSSGMATAKVSVLRILSRDGG